MCEELNFSHHITILASDYESVTSGTGTVSHYGEQTLGTLRLNARADGIGAEYLIIYRGN